MLRFTKATAADGVDGHFEASDSRVIVKPTELPAPIYPEDGVPFWYQFGDTINAVCAAHDKATMVRGGPR